MRPVFAERSMDQHRKQMGQNDNNVIVIDTKDCTYV